MFRFRGFKASLNLSGKTSGVEHVSPGISLNGAYRINRDELFGSEFYTERKKTTTNISTIQSAGQSRNLSKSTNNLSQQPASPINQSKSTNNLLIPTGQTISQTKSINDLTKQSGQLVSQSNNMKQPSKPAKSTKKSAPDVPQAVHQTTTVNIKEQKKLEKQRLAEQKQREKLAEKERKREDKLRKEREKLIVEQTKAAKVQQLKAQQRPKKEEQNKPKKRAAPQPQPQQISERVPPISPRRQQHSTNTLESSISKSSGPPPYSSVPELKASEADGSGNTSFAQPVEDMDSWGLISQHRQQMNRQAGVGKSDKKQKHLDLHYNSGPITTGK